MSQAKKSQPTNPAPNTEVVAAQTTALATAAPPQQQSRIIASDVIVPRVLLMQGTSDFVKERKASLGDIVKSTTLEKLADPDTVLEFIPLTEPTPGWRIEKRAVGAQRWEFSKNEPRSAINDGLPWKFNADKDGKFLAEGAPSSHEWRRVKTLSLFAILPADIRAYKEEMKKADAGELPDLSKALAPVLIDFRSTSFSAGKEVSTFFTQVAQFKATAWKYVLKLSCFLDQNDQGSYYVYKVDRNKPAKVDEAYLPDVEYWVNLANTHTLKVDEEVQEAEVKTSNQF
jgi:hypothetical protein